MPRKPFPHPEREKELTEPISGDLSGGDCAGCEVSHSVLGSPPGWADLWGAQRPILHVRGEDTPLLLHG